MVSILQNDVVCVGKNSCGMDKLCGIINEGGYRGKE